MNHDSSQSNSISGIIEGSIVRTIFHIVVQIPMPTCYSHVDGRAYADSRELHSSVASSTVLQPNNQTIFGQLFGHIYFSIDISDTIEKSQPHSNHLFHGWRQSRTQLITLHIYHNCQCTSFAFTIFLTSSMTLPGLTLTGSLPIFDWAFSAVTEIYFLPESAARVLKKERYAYFL